MSSFCDGLYLLSCAQLRTPPAVVSVRSSVTVRRTQTALSADSGLADHLSMLTSTLLRDRILGRDKGSRVLWVHGFRAATVHPVASGLVMKHSVESSCSRADRRQKEDKGVGLAARDLLLLMTPLLVKSPASQRSSSEAITGRIHE